jgi:hypothetical protein
MNPVNLPMIRVDAVRIAEYEGKIAELERKVGQLTMEVDLLKKGAWHTSRTATAARIIREYPLPNLDSASGFQ